MKKVFSTRLMGLRGPKTKQQFASYLGIAQNTYLRYEDMNDKTLPKIDVLAQIAKQCNVSTDWLLGLDDTRQEQGNPRAEEAERRLAGLKKALAALLKEY